MKLLIIGGTGLLSGAVRDEALKKGIEVTIVNRGRKSNAVPTGVKVITADYRDKNVMLSALHGKHFDAVIDFICFNREQIEYSVDLLSPFCSQYIFISSACVYDYSKPGIKSEDDTKVLKKWEYSVNKWDCESYLTNVANSKNIKYTIIRPCITYDNSRIPYGMTPPYGYHWTLIARIMAGKPIIRWNGGTTQWNMMRVEDFAVGLVGTIGNMKAYNQAYNISGDEICSWNDVIACVEKVINKKAIFYDLGSEEYNSIMPDKSGRIFGRSFDLICDNSKIKSLVPEFKMTYNLQSGIEKTIKSYVSENYQRGIDYNFDGQWDYIIRKSCEMRGETSSQYRLEFVDYLSKASFKDKLHYYAKAYRVRKLNNGYPIPLVGFGTFPYKDVLINCIPKALLGGLSLIDSSDNYQNETFVGKGLAAANKPNVIVVTKFSQPYRTHELEKCFEESKQKLGHINIYLLHWPYPYLWKQQWRKMEELYLAGKCDAIGVCNFDLGYLRELLSFCRVKPAINQIERHPMYQQQDIVDFCIANGIMVMAYSPVARMDKSLHEAPVLLEIAKKYNKSVNQVILRWDIDTDCIPIPASSKDVHIKENYDILDFTLEKAEIMAINSLEAGKRIRFNPRTRFSFGQKTSMFKYKCMAFLKRQL